ncbi:MAG TPA: hypothetical protein DCY13_06955 [Verrucomicrobiales bacterium]|nr:hypothetical protein [Verrucomicrobiales bacterium]
MKQNGQLHPIKLVAAKTGLSPHLIRVWERRYGAVSPERTDTHRRMYSELDIERLKLLGMLTESGHSIGNIATLDIDALRALMVDRPVPAAMPRGEQLHFDRREIGKHYVDRAVTAIADLKHAALENALQEGAVALGQQGVLIHVVAPLAEEVGVLWQNGTIGVAHEHFASAIIRTFLGNMSRPFAPNETSPHILTATPTGQLHELGAMLITAASVALGWQATYLGASISPVEIASALKQKPARVVGMSIVYPPDDPNVAKELRRLKQLLPEQVRLMVGGRAAPSYRDVIEDIGGTMTGPLEQFMACLQEAREG